MFAFTRAPVAPLVPAVGETGNDGSTAPQLLLPIKKGSDLNPSGTMFFVEYVEQFPPIVASPGMASTVRHCWRPPQAAEDVKKALLRKRKQKPKPRVKPLVVACGQLVVLEKRDETPFIGDVPAGNMVFVSFQAPRARVWGVWGMM